MVIRKLNSRYLRNLFNFHRFGDLNGYIRAGFFSQIWAFIINLNLDVLYWSFYYMQHMTVYAIGLILSAPFDFRQFSISFFSVPNIIRDWGCSAFLNTVEYGGYRPPVVMPV